MASFAALTTQVDAPAMSDMLNAAVELYKLYRDRDEEYVVEELIQTLGASNRPTEHKVHAKLFKGFLQARRGEYEKARKTFLEVVEGTKTTEADEFDRQRLQSLAEEFTGCLHRMGTRMAAPQRPVGRSPCRTAP